MLTIWTGQSSSGPAMEQRVSTEQGCLVCPQHCSWKGVEDKVSTSTCSGHGTGTRALGQVQLMLRAGKARQQSWLLPNGCREVTVFAPDMQACHSFNAI